ncbi:MAG: superoxide dismutase, Fe-Mn family [Candidatus Berkelbacteria bacterium Gr01-1014_85]|uniref:Superoxide dismutase n=1 Tax=Candidatus Berkelbacteria bacterium Gr01-1014_85 TaxID=2017150 RepID=A0A554JCU2_9BACT|nr:MAG: superoxide dismutase, Fe-Mn family [Candidatus Berkelbacteria bacterium Gr01-1014_85]
MHQALEFKSMELDLKGISRETMTAHYKLYQGYVNKANEIEQKLAALTPDSKTTNQTYSEWRELKLEHSFALGGIKNHVNYFSLLGGDGQPPTGSLADQIVKDFGSIDRLNQELKASAMAARGWVWLAYDWDTQKLCVFIGDAQNTYPIWNSTMLLALDTYEHAYWLDYQQDRAAYVEAFFANLDWSVPMQLFKMVSGEPK